MRTADSKTEALRCLRALARYETHGGYAWAAVMSDGDTMCPKCVRANYRQIFRATRDRLRDGWAVQGLANSGEAEETEFCCNCGKPVWEHDAS